MYSWNSIIKLQEWINKFPPSPLFYTECMIVFSIIHKVLWNSWNCSRINGPEISLLYIPDCLCTDYPVFSSSMHVSQTYLQPGGESAVRPCAQTTQKPVDWF
jgi:hypothetical protein